MTAPRRGPAPRAPGAPRTAALPRSARAPRPIAIALLGATIVAGGLGYWALDAASRRAPALVPRHRAEALCFALASPPPFEPPMIVQPSSAFVRGRFSTRTPAAFALREMMQFSDGMVLREWSQPVADYEVALFWLRFPGRESEHWLVAAWMEDADLAVCNFRFTGSSRVLSATEMAWGARLLKRVLVPEHFRRGELPDVRLETPDGATLPAFGPKAA